MKKQLLLAALGLTLCGATAHASDHANLEEGLPVQVEDAYPTAYLNREFQLMGRYERTADGENQYVVEPRLEYGFARNWQARINVPLTLGGGDKRNSGDLGLEAFYNFNTESLQLPAFAVSARAILPTGRDSSGVDTEFKFIATKSLGYAEKLQRVHLNLIYFANASRRADERANHYAAILGLQPTRRAGHDSGRRFRARTANRTLENRQHFRNRFAPPIDAAQNRIVWFGRRSKRRCARFPRDVGLSTIVLAFGRAQTQLNGLDARVCIGVLAGQPLDAFGGGGVVGVEFGGLAKRRQSFVFLFQSFMSVGQKAEAFGVVGF